MITIKRPSKTTKTFPPKNGECFYFIGDLEKMKEPPIYIYNIYTGNYVCINRDNIQIILLDAGLSGKSITLVDLEIIITER